LINFLFNLIFIRFVKKDKFETDIVKNHLLSFVVNNTSSSRCLFLNIINTIQFNLSNNLTTTTPTTLSSSNSNLNNSVKQGQTGDDLKYRLELFNLITNNGNNCRHLDPDLMSKSFNFFVF
jgi:hypothetical protein